jgi:hypothetical protein
MWRKTLGIGLLSLMAFALSGCYAHHHAYYRDGRSPAHVQVRIGAGYGRGVYVQRRSYRPYRYRQYRYYRAPAYHHRHYPGCGHRW